MPFCSLGIEPKPDWVNRTILAELNWLPQPVQNLIQSISPLTWEQQVVLNLVVNELCAAEVADPGELGVANLAWDTVGGALVNAAGQEGTLGYWIGLKLQYMAQFQVCQCKSGSGSIPPPVTPTVPTGPDTYPPGDANLPPLSRIERSLQDSSAADVSLYNGLQHTSSMLGDLYVRSVPALISNGQVVADHVTGEGCAELPLFNDPISAPFSPYATHVEVQCHSIPSNAGIRGTLNPRLYGVGSLMFDANYSRNYSANITGRQSIHYWREVMRLPARTQTYRICWRLMPGSDVSLRIYGPNPDNVMYAGSMGDAYGWLPFRGPPPPNWTDPPIYPEPPAGRRQFALGAPP